MITITAHALLHGTRITGNLLHRDDDGVLTDQPFDIEVGHDAHPADIAMALIPMTDLMAGGLCHGWSMPYRAADLDLMIFEFDFDGR